MGKNDADMNEFNDISALDPETALAQLVDAIGELLDIGDYDTVLEESTQVIELEDAPPHLQADALAHRAMAKSELGDAEGAVEDFNRAAEIYGDDGSRLAFVLVHRSTAYGNLGMAEQEIADLNQAIDMPDVPPELHAYALMNRAVIKEQAGDLVAAAADYEIFFRSAQPEPHNEAWTRCNYGWLLYRQGDYQGSLEQTQMGLEIDPEISFGYSNVGLALLRLGRYREAKRAYKQALKMIGSTEELDAVMLGDLKTLEAESPDTPGLAKILKIVEKRRAKLAKREG